MTPQEFLKTLYLGDRCCKSITIDGWNDRIVIEVNLISRIRSVTGMWDYYDAEDIEDGLIVFENANSISMSPNGWIPNDVISIEVQPINATSSDKPQYMFSINIGAGRGKYEYEIVHIQIIAASVHLEDPKKPEVKITE